MKFSYTTKPATQISCDLLVAPVFEEQKFDAKLVALDKALGQLVTNRLAAKDFQAKLGETIILFPGQDQNAKRLALVGLGKRQDFNSEKLRAALGNLAGHIHKFSIAKLGLNIPAGLTKLLPGEKLGRAVAESLVLSGYKFLPYKNPAEAEKLSPLVEVILLLEKAGLGRILLQGTTEGESTATIVNVVRDLGNHPANVATPSHLAKHAEDLARQYKNITAKILHRAQIKKEKMETLLAVSQGSDEEPKFIILEYLPRRQAGQAKKSAPRVVLAGKGITFDSGGISIKPAEKLEEMKFDMAGAATVMGIIQTACLLRLPINLVGLIPATENLPSGRALKPGDIVRSRAGKTIEIINTDAEGRLVLADALDYAKKYKPDLVIDFGTLTGALAIGLGDDLIGAFTNTPRFMPKLEAASLVTGETICSLPLYRDYEQFLKSDFADLRNIGTTRYGDPIIAALFLEKFIDYPWIHLDIASTAWTTREKPYRGKGATGAGVRLAIEFLKRFRK